MTPEEFDADICKKLDEIRTTLKDQIKHIEDNKLEPELRAMMAAVIKMTVDNKWNDLFDIIQKHHKQQKKERNEAKNDD